MNNWLYKTSREAIEEGYRVMYRSDPSHIDDCYEFEVLDEVYQAMEKTLTTPPE